ncbi:glycine-rich RNA-binding protein 1-like [Telopea speciosissima]|uniref:glycine-rich RNA-binding protein 1-like n=1 Tax=Telopea speciosissima TaxID=54955 RepID=UPI001CC5F53B|nr:glycine-rich RNA-binding protein 1-like [Telopea speciosissima]
MSSSATSPRSIPSVRRRIAINNEGYKAAVIVIADTWNSNLPGGGGGSSYGHREGGGGGYSRGGGGDGYSHGGGGGGGYSRGGDRGYERGKKMKEE